MLRALSSLLTARHIRRGVAQSCLYCPVAVLLREVPGVLDVEVTEDAVILLVREGDRTRTLSAEMPEAVQAWIAEFDSIEEGPEVVVQLVFEPSYEEELPYNRP